MSVLLVCLVLLEALPFLHSSLFFAPFGDMFLASMEEMEQDRLGKRSYGFMGQNETDRERAGLRPLHGLTEILYR